ncbi:MAG: DUF5103 domain-containing protein [Muribaculaceae bacterium]|nr:DUF5103 domain-containing protein [Muribaculaceae bacterium]
MVILIVLALILAGFGTPSVFADDTSTRIFSSNFKSLKVSSADDFMTDPVIRLGTDDRIVISFDEIGEDNSYLEYRLMHCNADWRPSRLIESEYVSGFNFGRIEDFAYSTATIVHYVNYRIEFPNDDMQVIHSGNYLLQVYNPDDPDVTLLQARFQVSENRASVQSGVSSRTDMGHNTEWQQIALAINTDGLGRINPYQDLVVTIMQNNSESSARNLRTPLRVDGNSVIYDHNRDLIFPAGNEYRRFESTSNNFPGMHVDSLAFKGSNYHVWLKPDYPRSNSQYSYDSTQHGRYIVKAYNATDSDIAADYITVHFTLYSDPLPDQEVYVDGEFTHDAYSVANRMVYDCEKRAYTAEIPLKQGAYNYRYISRPVGSGESPKGDSIEGNFYETDNEYAVDVYLRAPGSRADRLVNHTQIIR